jgi:hypothetical protein
MYDPVKDGVAKTVESVVYTEARPPAPLAEVVHCFWELKTVADVADDFMLHAVPDACVNLLFNQHDTPQDDRLHARPVQKDIRCLISTILRKRTPLQLSFEGTRSSHLLKGHAHAESRMV